METFSFDNYEEHFLARRQMFLFGRSADRSNQENRRQILDYDDIRMPLMQLVTYLPDSRTNLRLAIGVAYYS